LRTATWLVILASRVILNLGVRITYPFLPAIARGLGVPFEQAGLLVAARHSVGLTSPLWGTVSDRKGHALGMTVGLLLLAAGALTVALTGRFSVALAGFVLLGLAKTAYDPSVLAFVSARVPYSLRARAIGILETSWALSWFLGMPLSGVLIAHFGWHSPFAFLAGAAMLALLATRRLPETRSTESRPCSPSPAVAANLGVSGVRGLRAFLILPVTLFMVFANENMVIVYGAWLEEAFRLEVRALGYFSFLVGLAELTGELLVVMLVDRMGKGRAILLGLTLTGLSYLTLPFCQRSLGTALIGLIAMFSTFEFTIVSIFPYVSEISPARRGTWLGLNYTCSVLGRLAGSLSGPWLWQRSRALSLLAAVSVASQLLAIILVLSIRKEGKGGDHGT
jgi:predicted MFS family arabinose efflux permease